MVNGGGVNTSCVDMTIVRCAAILAAIQLMTAACSSNFSGKSMPLAIRGVMDLSDWNFERDGPVDLSGQWEFYWQQLLRPSDFHRAARSPIYIQVPGIWNGRIVRGHKLTGDGYATYRLRITMPLQRHLASGEKPPPMPDTFAPAEPDKKKEKKDKKESVAA